MAGSTTLRLVLATGTAFAALCALPGAAFAQSTPDGRDTKDAATPTGAAAPLQTDPEDKSNSKEIIITGSRIKQDPNKSALPLQIITTADIQRNGISSPEQLISFLPDNGNSSDNLASNSDVVTAERRGNNGASYANLRGQGSAATLVLLNGRRVAAQGTTGAAVDVNQIPFMALDRVEVLKDGASAIYGTDAVGGVINFITKSSYKGFGASAYSDVTEYGDAPIYRLSAIAGFGDLDKDGFNVFGTVGYSWISPLQAKDRPYISTFIHDKGLAPDTRGTPFATIVNLANTFFTASSQFPTIPGTTQVATGGINILRLPGQAGCASGTDMGDYDTQVWAAPGNGLACAFDTGKNVYLQQQLNTLTYYGRGALKLGASTLSLEIVGSDAKSNKMFSQVQITPNTTTQNYAYRLATDGSNLGVITNLVNILKSTFPTNAYIQTLTPQNAVFSYRWRCMECGERQIYTDTTTFRAQLGIEGPLPFGDWDYRGGVSYADSISSSKLGTGYYYQDALVAALNSGLVNPFLFSGQTQSAAGMAAIQSASAAGVVLYGGKYSVKQGDFSVSGSLFDLPGGTVKLAAGVDYRREEYSFKGDQRTNKRTIIAAPFDDGNALDGVHRDIKAAYAELLVPVFKGFELSAAGRIDDYTGFGTTTNPKISIKYAPIPQIMFRGSYNTAFRVPAFNQIFNPDTPAVYTGADFADPKNCPGGKVNAATGCLALSAVNGTAINIISGGNLDLGPETAREWSAGVVFQPIKNFSFTADWWSIHRENTIQVLPLQYLFSNYSIFQDRFIRNSAGVLTDIDDTYSNAGATRTQGIDFTVRAFVDAFGGTISAGADATWLLKKDEQVNNQAAFIQELGVYSLASDLGLRWKQNTFISYGNKDWSITLTQIYRSGYKNQVLPGIANGSFDPCCDVTDVKAYWLYNLSASVTAAKGLKLTFGVKNLFNVYPPFAISYDTNNGTGSDWEPRVADPRGRSFNVLAEVKF